MSMSHICCNIHGIVCSSDGQNLLRKLATLIMGVNRHHIQMYRRPINHALMYYRH
jgi:hypothetical protein